MWVCMCSWGTNVKERRSLDILGRGPTWNSGPRQQPAKFRGPEPDQIHTLKNCKHKQLVWIEEVISCMNSHACFASRPSRSVYCGGRKCQLSIEIVTWILTCHAVLPTRRSVRKQGGSHATRRGFWLCGTEEFRGAILLAECFGGLGSTKSKVQLVNARPCHSG